MVVSDAAPGAATNRDVPSTRMRRAWSQYITGPDVAMAGVLVLALAFYMWTAASTIPFSFPSVDQDVYNQLTTAFLHGHTYLPITPPAGLLHLSNPYDPAQNAPYNAAYHDLVLYHGHFYSQWGPTPVLTLFAPFRITGLRMSQGFAVALYAFIGLVCSVLLLRALVRRFVPNAPPWMLVVATLGLALTNTLPFLLRRPVQYEVAIASGYCFVMAGLWLMVTSVLGPRLRRWRMIAGSLCLGLAMGGRPTLAVCGAVAVAAALWELRRRNGSYRIRRDSDTVRIITYALGPFLLCALLLAWYNHVRFGGFTNFGERYELAGIDQTKAPFYKLSWVLPGLFTYLVLPVRIALTFPHAFLQTAANDPFPLPKGYAGAIPPLVGEPTGGILTTMPITLLLFGIPLLWRQRRSGERLPLLAATGLLILGLAIVTLVSWALFGTTERYEVDFVSLLLIPAFLVWAMLLGRTRPKTAGRRAWAVVGVVLTMIGAAIGTAISFTGYYDFLRIEHPAVFNAMERVTAPFATVATIVGGNPQIARIDDGTLPVTPSRGNFGFSEDHATAWLGSLPLSLSVLSPGDRHTAIFATVSPGPGAPPLSSVAINALSQGRSATVPLIGRRVRFPVSLHWGLNRVVSSSPVRRPPPRRSSSARSHSAPEPRPLRPAPDMCREQDSCGHPPHVSQQTRLHPGDSVAGFEGRGNQTADQRWRASCCALAVVGAVSPERAPDGADCQGRAQRRVHELPDKVVEVLMLVDDESGREHPLDLIVGERVDVALGAHIEALAEDCSEHAVPASCFTFDRYECEHPPVRPEDSGDLAECDLGILDMLEYVD